MTTFEERERAFEAKFAHDAEMQFRAMSRRNRKIGMWAAGLLGYDQATAVDYVRRLQRIALEDADDRVVLQTLAGDLKDTADEDAIRVKLQEVTREAKAELAQEA